MRKYLVPAIAALIALTGVQARAQPAPAAAAAPATRDLVFPSGDLQLSGRLYAPAGASRYPLVVMVGGSGLESVKGEMYTQILAKAFASRGIGVFAYDKRGTGASGGKFTGSDFRTLGADAAAAIRFARQLPGVERVGVWGISQAGWVIPYALSEKPGAAFAILVSPGGVNPHQQVTYFLHGQMMAAGLTEAEADKADAMHDATVRYYASGRGWREAQAAVDRHRGEPWFHKVVTHPYWDDMDGEGRLYTPERLAAEVAKRPGAFELVRSPSSFVDYGPLFARNLKLPTLLIYGSADEVVPVDRSRAVVEGALKRAGAAYEVKVFDGASHVIQTPDREVRPDYLELMAAWARAQFDKPA